MKISDLSLQLSLYQVTEERLKNKCAFPGVKAEEVFEVSTNYQKNVAISARSIIF